jgi:hypothetical protein
MRKKVEIVFRRKVRACWLAHGLELAAAGASWPSAKAELEKEIAAENSGKVTISKVLEHVRRIWYEPPDDSVALWENALQLIQLSKSAQTPFILNWGMTIAAYPFVGSVGETVGRLLRLQKEVHREDVQRRLREQYGDRDFVSRITRYTISSFLDWEIITETAKKGVYVAGQQTRPAGAELMAWLAEAVLISRDKTQMPISELSNHPALFPFALDSLNAAMLQRNPRLRVARQSLNQEFVFLDVSRD